LLALALSLFPYPLDKTGSPVRFLVAKRVVFEGVFLFSSFPGDDEANIFLEIDTAQIIKTEFLGFRASP
jgi:hypothetical protein